MKANKIKMNESQIREMIREIISESLNELQGNSSAPGTQYNASTGVVTRSQGGAYGHNGLDDAAASATAYKNQQAQMQRNSQDWYRQWCYNNYDYVMQMCPGYMNGGEYEKAYHFCN